MKTEHPIHHARSSRATQWWSVVTVLGLSSTTLLADVVIETRTGGQHTDWYSEVSGNWQDSSASITTPPATGPIGSRFFTTTDGSFKLTPTLVNGGLYILYNGYPNGAPTGSRNVVMAITATGCSGLPAATPAFQWSGSTADYNTWKPIGTLTASSANPEITFAYSSGSASRTHAAAFWLKGGPPVCPVPWVGGIGGPLTNGQMKVRVIGCLAYATALYIYTNNTGLLPDGYTPDHSTCIGTNNNPGGVPDTTVDLAYPLVTGVHVQGNQLAGCEPPPPDGLSGPIVGSGINTLIAVGPDGSGGWQINYSVDCGSHVVLMKTLNLSATPVVWERVATNALGLTSFPLPTGAETAAFYKILVE